VFLFGLWVQTPLLMHRVGMPFWMALFVSNGASVLLLNVLVPRVTGLFGWWLKPAPGKQRLIGVAGAALLVALYIALMAVFSLA
jgi:cytochrome b561